MGVDGLLMGMHYICTQRLVITSHCPICDWLCLMWWICQEAIVCMLHMSATTLYYKDSAF